MKLFDSMVARRPRLNKFDLTHEKKFSAQMGLLTPVLVQEIVPGDKFRVNSEIFMRMAPMLAPLMHNVDVFVHYFFVPNRLVWNEWEDFITGGREGTSMPVFPNITFRQSEFDLGLYGQKRQLWDFMGLPTFPSGTVIDELNQYNVSALPFRAYQMIYNEYFRDQNLTEEVDFGGIGSGNLNSLTLSQKTQLLGMRYRAFEKDYFTSALPWAQRGEEVTMPTEAVINYRDRAILTDHNGDGSVDPSGDLSALPGGGSGTNPYNNQAGIQTGGAGELKIDNIESIEGISNSINELRTAWSLQAWLEKNARGGARYIEQILSHFGVKSSDARLQRPEYLGGGRQPVKISEVLSTYQQTQEGIVNPPQGNMAGRGISGGATGFSRRFEEHGIVIGLMSVRYRTAYQQGIPRWLQRFDKLDHYFPEFANLGEQEVKTREVFYTTLNEDQPDLSETFGYQSRYAEMKYGVSTVHGDFKDDLSFWHLGRIFAAKPDLNQSFIQVSPGEVERIFAVGSNVDNLYFQVLNRVDALRPMPYYGTPSVIG